MGKHQPADLERIKAYLSDIQSHIMNPSLSDGLKAPILEDTICIWRIIKDIEKKVETI